jgi:hypothetical protein
VRVTVVVHGSLRGTSTVGTDEVVYEAHDGWRVRDLSAMLNIWDSEVREVHCNGQKSRLDAKLRNRDRIEFFARVSNGGNGARPKPAP